MKLKQVMQSKNEEHKYVFIKNCKFEVVLINYEQLILIHTYLIMTWKIFT